MNNWQTRYLKILEGYRPIDDDFLRVLLRGNLPLSQKILRIITGIDDLILTSEETQYDLKRLVGARSLCLDVLGTDTQGRKFNIEIQRADSGATAKRARYHSSSMDIEFLNAGDDFEQLPITYVIFITEHDVRSENRMIYNFERTDTQTGKPLDDGTHIIYVNGAYNDDNNQSELAKLIHDFRCTKADDMYIDLLAERTRYFKETPEGVSSVCKAMEELMQDFEKDVRADTVISTLAELVKDGTITIEVAASKANMSVEDFRKAANI